MDDPVQPGLTLCEGYILREMLGSGSFGDVYVCENKQGDKFAAKLEKRRQKDGKRRRGPSQLDYERRVYEHLRGGKGIPHVESFFVDGDYNVMVMQRLGKTVQDVLQARGTLSRRMVVALAVNLVEILKFIHDKGVVHRDLKPQNVCLGLDAKKADLFLIDFGLSKIFRDPQSGHLPFTDTKPGLTGTPRFVSIGTHLGMEQSRRDDLESLVYILAYLQRGKLPWQGVRGNKKEKYRKIMRLKQKITDRELSAGWPSSYRKFVSTVRALEFDEDPPYDKFIEWLMECHEELSA